MQDAQKRICDYYHYQPHAHLCAEFNFCCQMLHPSCGDSIAINGLVVNTLIVTIGYESQGCMLSQATTSLLADYFTGKHLDTVLHYTQHDLHKLVGLDLGPVRFKCCYLPLQALQQALKNYSHL